MSFCGFLRPRPQRHDQPGQWGLKNTPLKYDPQAVRRDPELYARLRERERIRGKSRNRIITWPITNITVSGTTSRPTLTSSLLTENIKTNGNNQYKYQYCMALNRVWMNQVKRGVSTPATVSCTKRTTDYSQFSKDPDLLHRVGGYRPRFGPIIRPILSR